MSTEHLNLIIAAAGLLVTLQFAPATVLAFVAGYALHAPLDKPGP